MDPKKIVASSDAEKTEMETSRPTRVSRSHPGRSVFPCKVVGE